MNEDRGRIRCQNCELVQWSEQASCRRCGAALPQPIVKVVERVVERLVVRHDPQCIHSLEQARQLIVEASDRLKQAGAYSALPSIPWSDTKPDQFPTMVEMERTMILAAFQRSKRKSVEAARLLEMSKTTFYRKLREIGERAA